MTAYPGNTSLSTAVKDRVTSTFQQTLALYKQGRTAEVVQGCTLLLQMDPLYEPAKKLMDKARNPASTVDVDSILPPDHSGPLTEARQALGKRDFERVIQITTEILTNDLMNDDARVLAEEAREKLEAGPFIEQFVKKCETHVANGNLPAARVDLEKARALDSGHPGLLRIQQMISQKESAAPASDASAFVVDAPAGGSRSAAQASDFGFTFEEDKKDQPSSFANFSFDSPAPAAPAPSGGFSFDSPASSPAATPGFSFDAPAGGPVASGEFDFSSASIETSPDDQKKIDQYIADGDRAFDSGDFQGAIDLWSRIFLIDVTNEAASERIERAKGKRREADQKVDVVLAAGIQAYERKDMTTARTKFDEALKLDPANASAQDYLERINSGDAPAAAFAPSASSKSVFDDDPSLGAPLTPPASGSSAPRRAASKPAPAPKAKKSLPMGLIATVIILAVVLGGGWYAWKTFMATPDVDPAASQTVIADAVRLGQQGKYEEAIGLLQNIKPGDPAYDGALQTIADLQQKRTRASASVDGKPAAQYYDENIAAGRAAMQSRDFLAAKKAFDNAQSVKPLPPDVKAMYDTLGQHTGKLDTARQLFGERKYQDAVTALESVLRQDPQNRSAQRMLTDAHFNLGATALQEENLPDAIREFDLVLQAEPNDELAKRSKELAQRYTGQTPDLLYRIYVKYLPLRQPAG